MTTGLLQYQNNSGKIQAQGIELEINGRPANWLESDSQLRRAAVPSMTTATASWQTRLSYLAKLRFAVPLGRKFDLGSGMQYESSRLTLAGMPSVRPAYLADFTLTSKHLLPNLDVRLRPAQCVQPELLRPHRSQSTGGQAWFNRDARSLWNLSRTGRGRPDAAVPFLGLGAAPLPD